MACSLFIRCENMIVSVVIPATRFVMIVVHVAAQNPVVSTSYDNLLLNDLCQARVDRYELHSLV